jgi:hypothetical protein
MHMLSHFKKGHHTTANTGHHTARTGHCGSLISVRWAVKGRVKRNVRPVFFTSRRPEMSAFEALLSCRETPMLGSITIRRTRPSCYWSTRRARSRRWIARRPRLPLKKETRRDDDARLQAQRHDHAVRCLDVKTGEVIGERLARYRSREFLKFLKKIDKLVARHFDAHIISDNYRTHKIKQVNAG